MRIAFLIFICVAMLAGCKSHSEYVAPVRHDGFYDFTVSQPAICEIHHVAMSPKLVELEFGLRAPTEMGRVRPQLFPHADESYDTGFCVPLEELRGRGAKVVEGRAEIVFFAAEKRGDLAKVKKVAAMGDALWVIFPKGVAEIREVEVIEAGRAAGLKDVKVARFSERCTGLKFV